MNTADGRPFVGAYRSEELDATWEFAVADTQLVVKQLVGQSVVMRTAPGDVLNLGNATLRFARDPSERITGFQLDAGRVRGIRFDRVR